MIQQNIFQAARWIGSGEPVFYAPYFSVFRISCDIQIPEGSHRAGLVLGADDPRFLDGNKNIFGTAAQSGECYACFELDVSAAPAVLNVYRAGCLPSDSSVAPLYRLEVPFITAENAHGKHTLYLAAVYGQFELWLDSRDEAHKLSPPPPEGGLMPFMDASLNLNPFGRGGDFICWPLLNHAGFRVPKGSKARFSNFTVTNHRKPESVLFFDGSKRELSGEALHLFHPSLLLNQSLEGVPLLRRAFDVKKGLEKAELTATARGIYDLYLNGSRVGDTVFEPGLTQYNRSHLYQTYDVTALVKHGGNALGAALGEGWWSGAITFTGSNWNYFGDRQSFICRLVLSYADGSRDEVVTDPETWKVFTGGQIRYGSFFQGEVWDQSKIKAVSGFSLPDYDDRGWGKAAEVSLSENNAFTGEVYGPFGSVTSVRYDDLSFLPGFGGAKEAGVFPALSVSQPRPGVYVYDIGQNIAGVPEIRFPGGHGGTRVTLRYAEVLYPDLSEYGGLSGMLMTENLRAAHCTDLVDLSGDAFVFRPRFTFHGFRYIEISGLPKALPPESVKAVALSSVPALSAGFTCSNEAVNQLYSNIGWSLRGNFLSIPTDCPQRNERMGWSGDLSVFARTAVYMADCRDFLKRHLLALRDTQLENGCFADIAPIGGGFGGVLWSTVGMTLPWEYYRQYGDLETVAEHYDAMVRYLDHLDTCVDQDGATREGALGDWLGPEVVKNEQALLWTAYHAYDLSIMAELSKALGRLAKAEKYERRYQERKQAFNRLFIDPETGKTVYSSEEAAKAEPMGPPGTGRAPRTFERTKSGRFLMDTQTSYAVPLALGVVDEAHLKKVRENLAESCRRENTDDGGAARPPYSLMTGFIGTAWVCPALSEAGYDDVAYSMLQNETYPSWLYSVRQGATTIWERLDSCTVEKGFGGNNSMNSFNHYSFGAVGAWLLTNCLGLGRSEEGPGFKRAILAPTPDPTGAMTFAEGYCDTDAGRYAIRWEKTDEGFRYQITVPQGAQPELRIFVPQGAEVTGTGKPVGSGGGRTRYALGPGPHDILVRG